MTIKIIHFSKSHIQGTNSLQFHQIQGITTQQERLLLL